MSPGDRVGINELGRRRGIRSTIKGTLVKIARTNETIGNIWEVNWDNSESNRPGMVAEAYVEVLNEDGK